MFTKILQFLQSLRTKHVISLEPPTREINPSTIPEACHLSIDQGGHWFTGGEDDIS